MSVWTKVVHCFVLKSSHALLWSSHPTDVQLRTSKCRPRSSIGGKSLELSMFVSTLWTTDFRTIHQTEVTSGDLISRQLSSTQLKYQRTHQMEQISSQDLDFKDSITFYI